MVIYLPVLLLAAAVDGQLATGPLIVTDPALPGEALAFANTSAEEIGEGAVVGMRWV
jgi:hypothetical protein